jgi:hypothetical protein
MMIDAKFVLAFILDFSLYSIENEDSTVIVGEICSTPKFEFLLFVQISET